MDKPGKMENLQFAQSMLRELRQTAKTDGEEVLTYLIDMAYIETSDRIRAHWADLGGHHFSPPRRLR